MNKLVHREISREGETTVEERDKKQKGKKDKGKKDSKMVSTL